MLNAFVCLFLSFFGYFANYQRNSLIRGFNATLFHGRSRVYCNCSRNASTYQIRIKNHITVTYFNLNRRNSSVGKKKKRGNSVYKQKQPIAKVLLLGGDKERKTNLCTCAAIFRPVFRQPRSIVFQCGAIIVVWNSYVKRILVKS